VYYFTFTNLNQVLHYECLKINDQQLETTMLNYIQYQSHDKFTNYVIYFPLSFCGKRQAAQLLASKQQKRLKVKLTHQKYPRERCCL